MEDTDVDQVELEQKDNNVTLKYDDQYKQEEKEMTTEQKVKGKDGWYQGKTFH